MEWNIFGVKKTKIEVKRLQIQCTTILLIQCSHAEQEYMYVFKTVKFVAPGSADRARYYASRSENVLVLSM